MTWLVRILAVGLLALATSQVYAIRDQLVYEAPDAAAVARVGERLNSLPLYLPDGGYKGRLDPEPDEVVLRSGADCHFAADYVDASDRDLRLYVGAALRLRRYFHRPRECLPSRGAEILEDSGVPFDAFETSGADPQMRRMLFQVGPKKLLVYFWFQAGADVSDQTWATSRFRFDDIVAGRSFRPAYICILFVPVIGDNIDAAERDGRGFLKAIGPDLRRVLIESEG